MDDLQDTQSEKKAYIPRHVTQGCKCYMHVFDSLGSYQTLGSPQESRILLVQVAEDSVSMISFSAAAEVAPNYTSISHVRSQGLGNSSSNSLPHCQIIRLQALVQQLFQPLSHSCLFWIDTACIPHAQPYKALALESVGQVYRRAQIVLALDESIENTPSGSAQENIVIIEKSAWAKRLWTIAEGALARCLQFYFHDSFVDLDVLNHQYISEQFNQDPRLEIKHSKDSTEALQQRNTAFINLLQLFERDLKAYLGKAPYMNVDATREEHKRELQSMLIQLYLSTPRFRYFLSARQINQFPKLRKAIERLYEGMTYDSLILAQRESLAGTLERVEKIRSLELPTDP